MLYQQIKNNKRKTVWLVMLFSLVVLATGWAIGYLVMGDVFSGIIITFIVLAFYIPMTYLSASKQVLSMSGARRVSREKFPQLFGIVEDLIIPSRLPMPKVYVVNDPSPNAFATGIKPKSASVAVTTGLLERLNKQELEGVIAHELAHIRNYDTRLMTMSIGLISVIVLLTEFGMKMLFFGGNRNNDNKKNPFLMIFAIVLVILAPIVAQMIKMTISINREYLADATAVEFTRNPLGLVNALEKISGSEVEVKKAMKSTDSMYISSPLNKRKKNKRNMWSTHPPIDRRIEKLLNM